MYLFYEPYNVLIQLFEHKHPYSPFIPKNANKLIVGTLPPPRFSKGKLFDDDVDFCYGSKYGLLWPILDVIFDLKLDFINNEEAIAQRKDFLIKQNIGICDIVESCIRKKIDASDLGMQNVVLRDLITILKNNENIETLLFMGGNSKNGPEYFFRKLLKNQGYSYKNISKDSPRVNQFQIDCRLINTISLISPSSSANRSIGANNLYKYNKKNDPNYSTLDFRIEQYKMAFR